MGPYEITAKLGEGGMGEVWRATDLQLGREVALKVLPEEFTRDAERTARFEREAKVLASLNHPNIAQIYGLESSGAKKALVMELVEGPTLAERLEAGRISLSESLSVARQVAEALEEAHDKGIVHRDLKPLNVKVSDEGKVKVLDFGLAKAMDPGAGPSGAPTASPTLMNSPTLTAAGTQLGVILGTAAYMAPEQAAGGAADRRADIWSFGVVLWEMLSGRRLFEGETVSHVLAGVLKDDPDLSALPAETPAGIRRLVRRCLAKKPRQRLQAIGDARIVLDEVLAGVADGPEAAQSDPARSAGRDARPAWVVALALATAVGVGALLAIALGALRAPAASAPRTTSEIALPTGFVRRLSPPAVSPDGTLLALVLRENSNATQRLWIRNLSSGDLREVPGTEGAQSPAWSPDGRSLAFRSSTDDQIKRVDLEGGRPVPVAKALGPCGLSWGRDVIVFCTSSGEPLKRVSPSGGPVEEAMPPMEAERPTDPHFLPDGKRFLFSSFRADSGGQDRLFVASLDGGEPRLLGDFESVADYDGGQLFFLRGETLLARPFDAAAATFGEGPARIVAEGVSARYGGQFSVASGILVYGPASGGGGARIAVYDRSGRKIDQIDSDTYLDDLVVSSDGRHAAVMKLGGEGEGVNPSIDVWTVDLERKIFSRATYGERDDDPVFSPDDRSIAFAHAGDLYRRPANGSGEPELLVETEADIVTQDWTGDGWIIYSDVTDANEDLWAVPAEGGKPKRLTATPYREGLAQLSPDGRWLAYTSDESGESQVYLTTWPAFEGKWRVSTVSAAMPRWGRGGRELYFLTRDSRLMWATISGSSKEAGSAGGLVEPEIGLAEELFPVGYAGSYTVRTARWAPTEDGERFLVLEAIPELSDGAPELILVTHPLAGTGTGR